MGMAWVEIMQCNVSLWSGDGNLVDHARNASQCFDEIGVEILLGFAWSFLGAGHHLLGERTRRETVRRKGSGSRGVRYDHFGTVLLVDFSICLFSVRRSRKREGTWRIGVRLSRECGTKLYDGILLAILGRIAGKRILADRGCRRIYPASDLNGR